MRGRKGTFLHPVVDRATQENEGLTGRYSGPGPPRPFPVESLITFNRQGGTPGANAANDGSDIAIRSGDRSLA